MRSHHHHPNVPGALIQLGAAHHIITSVRNERAPIASPIEALNFFAVSSTRRLATGALTTIPLKVRKLKEGYCREVISTY